MTGEAPGYLNVAEAAELLRAAPRTVYRWCRAGKLAAVKIGKEWRISADQPGLRSRPEDLAPLERLLSDICGGSEHLVVFSDREGLAGLESTLLEVVVRGGARLVHGRWEEDEAAVRRRLRPALAGASERDGTLQLLDFQRAYEEQGTEGVAQLLLGQIELAGEEGKHCCAYSSCYAYFGYHVDRLAAHERELHERVRGQPALVLCGYALGDFLPLHPGRGIAVCMELIHCHTGVLWFDGERALLRRPSGWLR